MRGKCAFCGCTEDRACEGGCAWLIRDEVCTSCGVAYLAAAGFAWLSWVRAAETLTQQRRRLTVAVKKLRLVQTLMAAYTAEQLHGHIDNRIFRRVKAFEPPAGFPWQDLGPLALLARRRPRPRE